MAKVVKQAEAADLKPGKFLMELEDLRVLPVVGKDPKAKLYKIGGNKKTSIRGDTVSIRAVRPSVDRDHYPDCLYALPNELNSPEKPVGKVSATNHPAANDQMCCSEPELDHHHPRDHLKKTKNQQQPLEKTDSPPSTSRKNLYQYGSRQRKSDKETNKRQTKQRKISRKPSHQCKLEKITLYHRHLVKPNHIPTAMHDNRSMRAKEPLIMRSVGGISKATDPKTVYYEKSEITRPPHRDPRQETETEYFEKPISPVSVLRKT